MTLTPVTVGFNSLPLVGVPGQVTTNLSPALLLFQTVALTNQLQMNLVPAVFTYSAQPFTMQPGQVTTTLSPANMGVTAGLLVSTPGTVSVVAAPASMSILSVAVSPQSQAVVITLVSVNLSLEARRLGQAQVGLVPAVISVVAIGVDPDSHSISIISNVFELDVQRRLTVAFIRTQPLVVVLTPRERVKQLTGGFIWRELAVRPPQTMRLVEPGPPMMSTRASEGEVLSLSWMLLGEWDAVMGLHDIFRLNGNLWEVLGLYPFNGWERRAEVVERL
jgi:hypothetical protein